MSQDTSTELRALRASDSLSTGTAFKAAEENMPINGVEARTEIQTLLIHYCQLLDDQRFEEWAELFCEDAIWMFGSYRFEGRSNIAEGLRRLEPPRPGMIRHLTFSPLIHFEGEEAYSWADNIALGISAEGIRIISTARYHDVLRREGGRWRFYRRVSVASGMPVPEGIPLTPTPASVCLSAFSLPDRDKQ
jgi:hypothetical protein